MTFNSTEMVQNQIKLCIKPLCTFPINSIENSMEKVDPQQCKNYYHITEDKKKMLTITKLFSNNTK